MRERVRRYLVAVVADGVELVLRRLLLDKDPDALAGAVQACVKAAEAALKERATEEREYRKKVEARMAVQREVLCSAEVADLVVERRRRRVQEQVERNRVRQAEKVERDLAELSVAGGPQEASQLP